MARKVEMIERRNIICLACKERVSHLWFSLKRISSCNLVDKKLFSSNKQNCIQLFRCVSISSTYPCESVGQLLTLSNKSSALSREKNARKSTQRCAKFTCIDCIDCIDWIECIECIHWVYWLYRLYFLYWLYQLYWLYWQMLRDMISHGKFGGVFHYPLWGNRVQWPPSLATKNI